MEVECLAHNQHSTQLIVTTHFVTSIPHFLLPANGFQKPSPPWYILFKNFIDFHDLFVINKI